MAPRDAFGISVSQLKTDLREEKSGAWAFYGPEEMLKQFYLQKFISRIEKEGAAEFNLTRLDLSRDATLDSVLAEAEILPFMGERRLVVVRGFSPQKLQEGQVKQLLELLEHFPDYLSLIFYLENEDFKADKQTLAKKSVKMLSGAIRFVSFPLQDERVLLPWATKILASDGVSCETAALRLLFRLSGQRMQIIRHELDKLANYALSQNKTSIGEAEVLLFAQDTTELNVFQLSDAVLDGAIGAVERILSNLKRQKAEAIVIVAVISRMLVNALLIVSGADRAACQKATRLTPWQYDLYQRKCYGKNPRALEEAFSLCVELDRKLKSVRSDPFLITERVLLQITRLCGGRA